MNAQRLIRVFPVLALGLLMASAPLAKGTLTSNRGLETRTQPSLPKYEWKHLSASEKAAVDAALIVIQNQHLRNVSLNIVDDAGAPYTGPIKITQESAQFDYSIGWEQSWSDYAAMTPSRTHHIWAPWNLVEPTEGTFDFSNPDRDYDNAVHNGMSVFHLRLFGPIMRDPSVGCCTILTSTGG